MHETVTVAVEIPLVGDERNKNWAKVVEYVDETQSSGWAYDGTFIATGGIQDVEAPCVILVYGERGSRANPQSEARVYTANTDGTLSHHATATGRAWARTLRDKVAELLQADVPLAAGTRPWDPLLMGYSEAALQEELRRRHGTAGLESDE
jgi:hypothetical protein